MNAEKTARVGPQRCDGDMPAPKGQCSAEQEARQQGVSEQTRKEYDALVLAMQRLEAALASAAPGRQEKWVAHVEKDLQVVYDLLVEHVHSTDQPEGLLAELDLTWPTHERRAHELQEQHASLLKQANALRSLIEKSRQQKRTDFVEIRKRAAELLTALRQHQAAETDLIFEVFYRDIGVGD